MNIVINYTGSRAHNGVTFADYTVSYAPDFFGDQGQVVGQDIYAMQDVAAAMPQTVTVDGQTFHFAYMRDHALVRTGAVECLEPTAVYASVPPHALRPGDIPPEDGQVQGYTPANQNWVFGDKTAMLADMSGLLAFGVLVAYVNPYGSYMGVRTVTIPRFWPIIYTHSGGNLVYRNDLIYPQLNHVTRPFPGSTWAAFDMWTLSSGNHADGYAPRNAYVAQGYPFIINSYLNNGYVGGAVAEVFTTVITVVPTFAYCVPISLFANNRKHPPSMLPQIAAIMLLAASMLCGSGIQPSRRKPRKLT